MTKILCSSTLAKIRVLDCWQFKTFAFHRYYYVPAGFSQARAGRVAAQPARRTCQNPRLGLLAVQNLAPIIFR